MLSRSLSSTHKLPLSQQFIIFSFYHWGGKCPWCLCDITRRANGQLKCLSLYVLEYSGRDEGFNELEYLLSMEQKEQKQVVGIFYINDVRKWGKKRKLGCHLMLDHNPIIIGIFSVFF